MQDRAFPTIIDSYLWYMWLDLHEMFTRDVSLKKEVSIKLWKLSVSAFAEFYALEVLLFHLIFSSTELIDRLDLLYKFATFLLHRKT